MIDQPIDSKTEAVVALIKGAVSAIPFAGGIITEIGNLYLNPLEKRKQQWISEVSLALEEIRRRFDLLPEALQTDERFISFLYQTTLLALKNHQEQKIDALRSALVSVANPDQVSDDVGFQFIRYIDELSVTHIAMLKCFDKNSVQLSSYEKLEQVYSLLDSKIDTFIDRATFRSFLNDLDSRFLIRIGDLYDLPEFASRVSALLDEQSEIRPFEITNLGCSFLRFINNEQS